MSAEETRDRLVDVVLDEASMVRRSPEVEHERAVAVYDLLEENSFAVIGEDAGPYVLRIAIEENRLVFDIKTQAGEGVHTLMLSLTPFRTIIRDYFLICESYYSAIKTEGPAQIEAIDMGRRGIHNEGAEMLAERLGKRFKVDLATARRLFTLVCVLQVRG